MEWRDDGRCIFCRRHGRGEAHVINRSQGGLGIEQNIVTVCRKCHDMMDNGKYSAKYREAARNYLAEKYPQFDFSKAYFKR